MSDIDDLKVKRGRVLDKMENMRHSVENWDESATSDFENLSNEFDELSKKINQVEAFDAMKDRIKEKQAENASRPGVGKRDSQSRFGTEEYEENFRNFVMSGGREFRNDLEVGTDAEGGFVVSESWDTELDRYLEDQVVIRQLATVRNHATDRNIPISDGNVPAGWIAEEGSYPTNDKAFSNKKLVAHKLGNILKVSEELLEDSFINLQAEIGWEYGETFGVAEELAFTSGDGSGKPTGFVVGATVGKTAASTSAITMDEIIDLMTSVRTVYARSGTFMMNRTVAAIVRKLKDSNGAYLWQPSLQAGVPETLLGKVMAVNEAMANPAASAKPIAFGNFKFYRIADRGNKVMQILREKYADTGQVGFKIHKRVDGLLKRAEAIKTLQMAAS